MTPAPAYDPPMPDTERLTRQQAAEQLGISLSRLADYGRTGVLTRYRNPITRLVTYDAAEVEKLRKLRSGEDS